MIQNANIAKFLPEAAKSSPAHCAVKILNKSGHYSQTSFLELDVQACRTVSMLKAQGIKKGTRVLLMVKPGLDLILVTFALFKVGAVPIIIDPGMGLRKFLKCVKQSQPYAQIGIPIAHGMSKLFTQHYNALQIRITAGTKRFISALDDYDTDESLQSTSANDLAAVLFTSGSTGPPKGVCYTHGMLSTQVHLIRDQYDITPGEIDLPMLPIFALFNPALGMTTVVPEINPSRPATVKPEKIVRAIQQCEVTSSFGSPVLWGKIGRYCEANEITLPSIKRILMAGAPVSPSLVSLYKDIIPNGMIHTPYGATEALPVSTFNGSEILQTSELTNEGYGTCVGHIFPGTQIKIINATNSNIDTLNNNMEAVTGHSGEIIVRSPIVSRDYDHLPNETAASKINDPDKDEEAGPWHRMGDIGYIDSDDRLWFCGRKVETVQTAQGPLYTNCCESIFNQHPKVYRTALIGLGEAGAQIPAIVIELERGKRGRTNKKQLIVELKELASKHVQTRDINKFFFHRKFPVDVRHNAKIHRLNLRKIYNKKR